MLLIASTFSSRKLCILARFGYDYLKSITVSVLTVCKLSVKHFEAGCDNFDMISPLKIEQHFLMQRCLSNQSTHISSLERDIMFVSKFLSFLSDISKNSWLGNL